MPPHAIWPIIKAGTPPGDLAFPNRSKNNINRILKFNLDKLGFLGARKFTSNAFRRGDTQELRTTGNSLDGSEAQEVGGVPVFEAMSTLRRARHFECPVFSSR